LNLIKSCRKTGRAWCVPVALALGGVVLSGTAAGQALRLGPMDFDMAAGLKGVYSSNVEGERPSDATEERTDYFFVASLDLNGHTSLAPSTQIDVDTGIAVERHLNRPDLDDSQDPFGRFRLAASTKWRHSEFRADFDAEHKSESKSGVYDPGSRKKRAPHKVISYGVGWAWAYSRLRADASYSYEHTRYDDEEYKDDDEDKTTVDFGASWQLTKKLSIEYQYERKLEDYVFLTEEDDDWEVKAFAGLRYDVFQKPLLSVYVGYTKDSEESNTSEWYPTIGADFSATLLDTERWELSVDANWQHVDEIPNDSKLTYSGTLKNQISRTAEQTLTAMQEPVETLGSNKDTDQTTVAYSFKKDDLFIYNLNFLARVEWKKDKPVEDEDSTSEGKPTEYTWTYDVGLNYIRALTRKLRRELRYTYTCEDSNLYDEVNDEHRVELEFIYTF
jgi:hypothetical protein